MAEESVLSHTAWSFFKSFYENYSLHNTAVHGKIKEKKKQVCGSGGFCFVFSWDLNFMFH